MKDVEKFIHNVKLNTVVEHGWVRQGAALRSADDYDRFRNYMIEGHKKLLSIKDKFKGKNAGLGRTSSKKALVMGHGPTLLDINKDTARIKKLIEIDCLKL